VFDKRAGLLIPVYDDGFICSIHGAIKLKRFQAYVAIASDKVEDVCPELAQSIKSHLQRPIQYSLFVA
jgi:hypothetical protein